MHTTQPHNTHPPVPNPFTDRTDLELVHVDAAEDLGGADALGHAGEARVDEPREAAARGAGGRHDGGLRARVDEGLDGLPVHFRVDVQHHHLPERLFCAYGGWGG